MLSRLMCNDCFKVLTEGLLQHIEGLREAQVQQQLQVQRQQHDK